MGKWGLCPLIVQPMGFRSGGLMIAGLLYGIEREFGSALALKDWHTHFDLFGQPVGFEPLEDHHE